eukprot:8812845-Alexandrium_andersonii.AAC.1
MLDPRSRRWPLAGFSNTRKRAVLGNSDGAPPWGRPEPMGRCPRWAKISDGDNPVVWEVNRGPVGPAPPMGVEAFGALPADL